MNNIDEPAVHLTRKGFLRLFGTVLSGASMALAACTRRGDRSPTGSPASWWTAGKYVVHDAVDTSRCDRGVIRARLDGRWKELKLVELPEAFVEWSLSERADRLERLAHHGFSHRDLAGPHNACVATFGGPPRDSAVSLNTAYKGMGFAPRPDRLTETIGRLGAARHRIEKEHAGDLRATLVRKTRELGRLYADRDLFDRTKQVSLELFTHSGYHTHTFLNMMANPIASASFLAFPTFEIRAVPQLLHPDNPRLSTHERGLVTYANAVHDFVHGGEGGHIACVYHVIEVFDDTPRGQGAGRRLA
jgi:hypothetical protein